MLWVYSSSFKWQIHYRVTMLPLLYQLVKLQLWCSAKVFNVELMLYNYCSAHKSKWIIELF